MKELSAILGDLGCENVETYIQSGNVVFRSHKKQKDKLAEEIGQRILKKFKFEPKVLLLDVKGLKNAIKSNPFDNKDARALHFFFLDSLSTAPDLERLEALKTESEKFKLNRTVFYLYAPDGIGRSKLVANVEKCLGAPVTARNWNTVSKLMEIVAQG